MEALLTQLNQIQEKLQTYQMTKDVERTIVLPKYTLKFECTPTTTTTDTNESSETESQNLRDNSARRSNRRYHVHPYRRAPVTIQKNILPQNGETDRH